MLVVRMWIQDDTLHHCSLHIWRLWWWLVAGVVLSGVRLTPLNLWLSKNTVIIRLTYLLFLPVIFKWMFVCVEGTEMMGIKEFNGHTSSNGTICSHLWIDWKENFIIFLNTYIYFLIQYSRQMFKSNLTTFYLTGCLGSPYCSVVTPDVLHNFFKKSSLRLLWLLFIFSFSESSFQ